MNIASEVSQPLVIGLDIGGANLKLATSKGECLAQSFEIWKAPEQLGEVLAALLAGFPRPDVVALTVTAELADCFATKQEGIARILDAVERVAQESRIQVWSTQGEFVTPAQACERPLEVAAANWHALATWAGRWLPEPVSLLLDIGSTTTDIIPLHAGVPAARGRTDSERLMAGELVYSGVRRTPLCALALAVPFRGGYCPVAAEWFATTLDIYLLLGDIPEDASDMLTANGRPATIPAAHDRLARLLCCDRTELSRADVEAVAHFFAEVQRRRLDAALAKVLAEQPTPCTAVLISGSGRFLARKLISQHSRLQNCRIVDLGNLLNSATAECACAAAVASLAAERNSGRR